jgi:hypothetical protein
MKVSNRLVLPLAGVAVLAVAVLGVLLWPESSAPPAPPAPPPPAASVATVTPEPPRPGAPPRQPAPSTPAPVAAASTPEAPQRATVVPVGPGDEVPLPEVPNPPPQVNDPIEPEKPQTARWKLGKTERITTLLTRDVARLEQDRDAAKARGDEAERLRLDTLIQRHQGRLKSLQEETQKLSHEAENEPPEQ